MGWFRYFRRAHRDRQLCRELESYIDIETDVNVARGMTLDDARLAARRKLGNRTAIREEVYIMNSAALVETLWQDAAYAMRAFWKNKAWTATAVLTLALGIGANTAIFSVVDAVLFHPLPYQEPNRLMAVRETFVPRFPVFAVAPGSFLEWRMQNTTFERLAAVSTSALNLTGGDEPERLPAARVSEGLFELLGMPPALGRGFTAAEMEPGRDLAVVLSYGLWQRRFGGDPELIGQAITLSDRRYTVIGIAPRGLAFPTQDTQLWTPLALTAEQWDNYGGRYLRVFGRLTAEVTLEQARAEMLTIAARIEQARPDTNTGWSVSVVGLHEVIVGDTRPALLVLAAAVGLVLLIACANVANMLLARAASREQEIAVRMALGASRRRVVRQLLTESLLLALAGATGGVLLAAWGTTVLPSLAPAELPRIDQIRFDGGTLLFTLVVGLLTGVLFGLVPALQASRHGLHERLKNGGRGSSAGRGQLLRSGLVVAEMGLAVMLLIGAGLLIQSFAGLQRADPGFNPDGALVAQINLSGATEEAERRTFYGDVMRRISALPGVAAVGATHSFPIAGDYLLGFQIEGRPEPAPGEMPITNYYAVTPDFFRAMGIPLLRSRWFTEDDREGSPNVAVINQAMADQYFPDEDPIGQAIHVTYGPAFREIVGIVGNTKQYGLAAEAPVQTYEPLAHRPFNEVTLVVRTTGDPAALGNAVRAAVVGIDPDQPVSNIRTVASVVSDSVARERFAAILLGIFATVALVLAVIGIYGVMAYSVAQRTHEMGIRMALGAEAADVRRLVVFHGMRLALAGVGVGVLASFAAARALGSLLFGVSAIDPMTFAVSPILLAGAALVATYVPACRATRIDPLLALRHG